MAGAMHRSGPNEGRHRADFTFDAVAGPTREPAADPVDRPGSAARRPSSKAFALEHEAARMRAKLMDPEVAFRELAERLTFAHVNAGKPSLGVLSEAVHYSKGTLSRVFAGKMMPSWPLVEDLAVEFGVPSQTVVREWFPLWTAANTLRRRPAAGQDRAAAQPARDPAVIKPATAHPCRECGSWTADPALHTRWHRKAREAGRGGSATGSHGGWPPPTGNLRREMLGVDGSSLRREISQR